MEPDIEDVFSKKVKNEIGSLQTLESRVSWIRSLTLLGGLACSFWLIYLVFAGRGFFAAILAFFGLSIVYKFGVSPMFAVAASVLCFGFKAVGIWLPVISYILAAVLLYVDLKRDALLRRVDPCNLGSTASVAPAGRRTPECEAIRQKLRLPLMYDEEKIDRLVAMERERLPGATEEQLHAAAYEHWLRDNQT